MRVAMDAYERIIYMYDSLISLYLLLFCSSHADYKKLLRKKKRLQTFLKSCCSQKKKIVKGLKKKKKEIALCRVSSRRMKNIARLWPSVRVKEYTTIIV